MFKRVWQVSLAVLMGIAIQAGTAVAWEIQVRNEGGYPARAVEDGVKRTTLFRGPFEQVRYYPIGAATEQFRSGTQTLNISDNKEFAVIIGYLWDDDALEPEEIARFTVRKDEENKCFVFRGMRRSLIFERC